MASLQPTVGGIPQPSATKTFADAVLSHPTSHTLLQPDPTVPAPANPSAQGLPGLHKGLPSISFSDAATSDLSRPFSWTLIGKFSQGYNKKDPQLGRPSVDDLQKFFLAMDFHGSFHLGLLDNRHLLIQFKTQEDYLRVYSRQIWYIRAVTMRIFKWSPYFRVDKESSIVPLWISFPRLPVHLFQRDALFSIARLIGEPLRVDDATSKLKRPSVARLQVELDVLRDRPPKVWIQMGSKEGFWQAVDYENVPPYCCHCWHIGHHEQDCRILHPALKSSQIQQPKQVYVAKQSAHHADNHASGSGLVAEQMATSPVSASVGNEVRPKNLSVATVDAHAAEPHASATVDIGAHGPEPKVPASEDHAVLDFVEPAAGKGLAGLGAAGISAGEPSLAALTTINLPEGANLAGVAINLPVAPVASHAAEPTSQPELLVATQAVPILPSLTVTTLAPEAAVDKDSEPTANASAVLQLVQLPTQTAGSVAACRSPLQPSSLQATYKNVLVDNSLQGMVAQEIGFPPTAIESASEHALVVYQSDGHANDSTFVSTPTSLSLGNRTKNRWHPALDTDFGYNDSDYYPDTQGSDELGHHNDYEDSDDHTYEDITDGSEGTHMTKKKDRRKLKGLATTPTATIHDFTAQSRLIDLRLRKRGRPPGSRNRTYFDVHRTMSTRATKATSD